jgi:hypothetical protein
VILPPAVSATPVPPSFASYRNAVEELVDAGEPFVGVEEAIAGSDLHEDMKDALWLLAFFQHDPRQELEELPHLASVE